MDKTKIVSSSSSCFLTLFFLVCIYLQHSSKTNLYFDRIHFKNCKLDDKYRNIKIEIVHYSKCHGVNDRKALICIFSFLLFLDRNASLLAYIYISLFPLEKVEIISWILLLFDESWPIV